MNNDDNISKRCKQVNAPLIEVEFDIVDMSVIITVYSGAHDMHKSQKTPPPPYNILPGL